MGLTIPDFSAEASDRQAAASLERRAAKQLTEGSGKGICGVFPLGLGDGSWRWGGGRPSGMSSLPSRSSEDGKKIPAFFFFFFFWQYLLEIRGAGAAIPGGAVMRRYLFAHMWQAPISLGDLLLAGLSPCA